MHWFICRGQVDSIYNYHADEEHNCTGSTFSAVAGNDQPNGDCDPTPQGFRTLFLIGCGVALPH